MPRRKRAVNRTATERLQRLVAAGLESHELTREEVAREARLPGKAFSALLRNGHRPTIDRADELCKALGINMTIGTTPSAASRTETTVNEAEETGRQESPGGANRMPMDGDGSREGALAAEAVARVVAWPPGSGIIAHAERVAANQMRAQQQAVIWAAAALRAETIDETTLLTVNVPRQIIQYASQVVELENETAEQYADRLTSAEVQDVLAAARDKVADAGEGTPISADDLQTRLDAVERIENARRQRMSQQPGDEPAPGGIVDGRATAPGLRQAGVRLRHYTFRAEESLGEMQSGPAGTPWWFVEHLDIEDLAGVMVTGRRAALLAATIIAELSALSLTPATHEQRATIAAVGTKTEDDLTAIVGLCEITATLTEGLIKTDPWEGAAQTTH